jgi:pimeloyl-ACP methyl ester carboxylesterase
MIAHHRLGDGPPLVLIHGLAHRRQAWDPITEHLAVRHQTIAIDLPGFGESPLPADGFPRTVERLVARIGEFFTEIGVDRPHVAGNSLGGAVALELARAGLVSSATALSPAGFATVPERRRALLSLLRTRAATFAPVPMITRVTASPRGRTVAFRTVVARGDLLSPERALGDALAMRRGKGFVGAARSLRLYEFPECADLAVPVTVAWGELDRILAPHQADRARQLLPRARHVTLIGCGHVPMSDDPDRVAAAILETTMPPV